MVTSRENMKTENTNKGNIKVNTILNMIKTITSVLFPLVTFPYVSRVLQPDSIGKINFSNSNVCYFSLLATLGIMTYAIRECSIVREKRNELEKTASQIFSINIFSMILSYILLFICLAAVPKLHDYRLLIAVQSLTIICDILGTEWLFMSIENYKYITIRTISFQFISLILTFLFVRSQEDYFIYALITVFSASGSNIVNFFYRKKICKIKFTLDLNLKKHMPPIILLFAMLITQSILNNIDVTMLGFIKGDYEVGLYTTAMKVINVLNQLTSSMFWVFVPQLTLAFSEKNYYNINSLLKKATGFISLLVFPISAGVILLSSEMIYLVGGREYKPASFCLSLLAISMVFSNVNSISGNMILLASKRDKQFAAACCAAMLVNIILNYVLIPYYGIYGAAFATIISSITIDIVSFFKWDRNINAMELLKTTISPVVGTALIIVFGICIKSLELSLTSTIAITVLGSVVLYLLVLWLLKNCVLIEFVTTAKKQLERCKL